MSPLRAMTVMCLLAIALAGAGPTTTARQSATATSPPETQPAVRFIALDVHVNSKDRPLAAYQFELTAPAERFAIVGVEGGSHAAFAPPPYYDPAALSRNRIIIAAFNTGKDLPTGRTRVARIHARLVGDQDLIPRIKLIVAASADGGEIPATATVVPGGQP